MSITVMSHVWKNSRASHGSLLVLLAIADFADDDGFAYPSIATLQNKSRLSERATQNAIRELTQSGELTFSAGEGRNGTNLYRVQLLPPAEIAPPQKTTKTPAESAPKPSGTVNGIDGVSEVKMKPSIKSKLPTTEPAIRISEIFHRKLSTEWNPKEIAAFKKLPRPLDMEELALLEEYYASHWPPTTGINILRHDLLTFLNNYCGEIDRARTWKENPKRENIKKTTNGHSSGSSGRNEGTFNANGSAKFAGVEKLA